MDDTIIFFASFFIEVLSPLAILQPTNSTYAHHHPVTQAPHRYTKRAV